MITIVARNVIREGKQEDFLKAVQPLIEASRAERGNVFYDLYEDVADSRAFCFIERWADEEAVAAHNASPHFRAWTAAKAEFVEAGTVARYRADSQRQARGSGCNPNLRGAAPLRSP